MLCNIVEGTAYLAATRCSMPTGLMADRMYEKNSSSVCSAVGSRRICGSS
jgi:hypothetical protein